jgi:predicted MFS family arabinose efflux permease
VAFAVSAGLGRPVVGRIGDRLGRRPLAVVGGAIAAVSIACYGLVESLPVLVAFRLVTGLGEAAFFVGVATAAQDLSPDHRRAEAASFFSIAIYGGLAVGPFLGEVVYKASGPDRVWLVSAVLAGIAALLSMRLPGDLGRNPLAPDEPGSRRFLHPAAVAPGAILLLGLGGAAAFFSFLALHLEDLGIDDAGPYFLVYGFAVLVIRIFGARIPDRLGAIRTTTMSLVLIGLGMAVIATGDKAPAIMIGTLVFSVGMSLLFPALFSLVVNLAPVNERSHAVGTFSFFFDLSQGIGAPILGIAVDLADSDSAAFAAAAGIALGGLVLARARLPRLVASLSAEDTVPE